eukprot:5281052-Prymnesium_polylepis.2
MEKRNTAGKAETESLKNGYFAIKTAQTPHHRFDSGTRTRLAKLSHGQAPGSWRRYTAPRRSRTDRTDCTLSRRPSRRHHLVPGLRTEGSRHHRDGLQLEVEIALRALGPHLDARERRERRLARALFRVLVGAAIVLPAKDAG